MNKQICMAVLISSLLNTFDGQLDDSFGPNNDGTVTFNFQDPVDPNKSDFGHACVVRYDGTIVAGGVCTQKSNQLEGFALLGLSPDGSVACMNCLAPFFGLNDCLNGLAVQPDNKVVAVGTSFNQRFVVARFNQDCSLDTSFGNNGMTVVPFPDGGQKPTIAYAVALKRDGRIVVVGQASNNTDPRDGPYYAVAVLNPDGTLDSSFASGAGIRIYDKAVIPDNRESFAFAVAMQSIGDDENILVGGVGLVGEIAQRLRFQVVRIACDGSFDTSFGSSGVAEAIFTNNNDECVSGVDVLPDGRIIVIGTTRTNQTTVQIALAKFTKNGLPDATFGNNDGKAVYPTSSMSGQSYNGLALNIQNNQKIVVSGFLNNSALLARFNTNGTIDDASFNPPNGFVTTTFGVNLSTTEAVALQCDGKIVTVGTNNFSPANFAIARYLNENGNDEVLVEPTITQPTNLGNCNTPQPTFSGTAQNPANITVYIDGQEAGRVITQAAANTWEFTPSAPLATGSHTVQMVAEYKSGNQNCITDPLCCGVCLGCQSCLSEAVRPKYCSCINLISDSL